MKALFKTLIYTLLAIFVVSCETEEKVIDYVFENTQNGAFLRITDFSGTSINKGDTSSSASVSIEYGGQDVSLLQDVTFSISYSGQAGNKGPVDLSVVTPDQMGTGQYGNPTASYSYTLGQALSALGITANDITGGDRFSLGMTANLTDGRSYGPGDANGNIGAVGGWYSSPYVLTSSVVCILPPTPGTWTIEMADSYGDGWQTTTGDGGPGLQVIKADGTVFAEVGLCTPYETAPFDCVDDYDSGTATIEIPAGIGLVDWYFPGDYWGEISIKITSPSGNVVGTYGPGTGAGNLALNLCNEPVQ
jgi:hypothetical protein